MKKIIVIKTKKKFSQHYNIIRFMLIAVRGRLVFIQIKRFHFIYQKIRLLINLIFIFFSEIKMELKMYELAKLLKL